MNVPDQVPDAKPGDREQELGIMDNNDVMLLANACKIARAARHARNRRRPDDRGMSMQRKPPRSGPSWRAAGTSRPKARNGAA